MCERAYDSRLWLQAQPGAWSPWRTHVSHPDAGDPVPLTFSVRHRRLGRYVSERPSSSANQPVCVEVLEFDRRVAPDGGGWSAAETGLAAGVWMAAPTWRALWTPEDSLLCGGCFHHIHLPARVAGTPMQGLGCSECSASFEWLERNGEVRAGTAPLLWEGDDGSGLDYVVRDALVAVRRAVTWRKVAYRVHLWSPPAGGGNARAAHAQLERPFKRELMERMWHPDLLAARYAACQSTEEADRLDED